MRNRELIEQQELRILVDLLELLTIGVPGAAVQRVHLFEPGSLASIWPLRPHPVMFLLALPDRHQLFKHVRNEPFTDLLLSPLLVLLVLLNICLDPLVPKDQLRFLIYHLFKWLLHESSAEYLFMTNPCSNLRGIVHAFLEDIIRDPTLGDVPRHCIEGLSSLVVPMVALQIKEAFVPDFHFFLILNINMKVRRAISM